MTPRPTPSRTGLMLLIVLAVFWGINWPILKIALRELPVLWFRFACTIGAGIGLLGVAKLMGYSLIVPRAQWLRLALISLGAITGWNLLSAYGIARLPAGRAAMLGYTLPFWVVLLSLWVLKERLTARLFTGLVLGMVGIACLIGNDFARLGAAPLGALAMLGAAFSWAVSLVLLKRTPLGLPATVQTAWLMLIGGLPLVFLTAVDTGLAPPPMSQAALWALLYNIFVAGILCYWAFFKLADMLPANVMALSSLIVPMVGFLAGMVWLGERPNLREWIGVGLLLSALGAVMLPGRKQSQAS